MLLLIIVLNILEMIDHNTEMQIIHRNNFENDLEYCHKCFQSQIQHCSHFFQQIRPDKKDFSIRKLMSIFFQLACKRNNHLIQLINSNEKLITKYLYNQHQISANSSKIAQLKREFLQQQENLQGMQYAPLKTIDNFVKNLHNRQANLSRITIWIYLLNNIQLLIYPPLYERKFPVPKTYAVCGFTLYQQYGGENLYNFFKTDFLTKLEISKQLLKAAIQFSNGFDNYRLYITDLTADNIVYDKVNNKVYFIDLDTVFIVDSTQAKHKSLIHKHVYMECPGCFAYSAHDIASYNISDVNIFSVCQLLREDLYKEHSKGFLYPIPSEFASSNFNLWQLLNQCVDCPDNFCLERFTAAKDLIKLFEEILQYSKQI